VSKRSVSGAPEPFLFGAAERGYAGGTKPQLHQYRRSVMTPLWIGASRPTRYCSTWSGSRSIIPGVRFRVEERTSLLGGERWEHRGFAEASGDAAGLKAVSAVAEHAGIYRVAPAQGNHQWMLASLPADGPSVRIDAA
jgi:hypothetical protein